MTHKEREQVIVQLLCSILQGSAMHQESSSPNLLDRAEYLTKRALGVIDDIMEESIK